MSDDIISAEKARELLVGWADHQVRFGSLTPTTPMLVEPYLSAAVGKGWVSVKGDAPKVLAKGFAAAAAYLKWLQGEFGMDGLFLGVPCKLGRNGLGQIIEVELTDDERAALGKSADAVRETMALLS